MFPIYLLLASVSVIARATANSSVPLNGKADIVLENSSEPWSAKTTNILPSPAHKRTRTSFNKPGTTTKLPFMNDPLIKIRLKLLKRLYGLKAVNEVKDFTYNSTLKDKMRLFGKLDDENGKILHFLDGQNQREELFNNKSAVHLPPPEYLMKGITILNVTTDYMQTAVNAFAILMKGTVEDVERLPPDYILRSARTIAMMKISREKLATLWQVLKNGRSTKEVTYEELEMYRPLFKYVNAREISRLNLNDTNILNFIGTHADLDRHQVGVIASKYMQWNPRWSQVKYLNHMNNLLCGVPVNFMRKIPSEVYLQLSHQVFYHIRACDPIQRRFYLGMMTKTEALGKSYSWSARDVSRLGLLLADVQGPELAAINPEAMSGITAQVMMEIPAENLEFLTDVQVQYLALKPLTIFGRKLQVHSDSQHCSGAPRICYYWREQILLFALFFTINKN